MNKFSKRSKEKLDSCHNDIITLMNEVLKIQDITIVEGHRNKEKQNEYYDKGASKLKYPDGKHNSLPSKAVDVAPFVRGKLSWDKEDVLVLNGIIYAVWYKLYNTGVITHKIRLGMNWDTSPLGRDHKLNSFFDGCHIEILN